MWLTEEEPVHADSSLQVYPSRENILVGFVEKLWEEGRDISQEFPSDNTF